MSASAGGIRAGQAYVELLADDSKLRAGLAAAQKQLSAWGTQIRQVGLAVFAAGAGMLAPLLAATKQFASSGDALAKMSARTGMSVELLSELRHAASVSGAELEYLEKASRKLSVTITSAMKGSQTALDALGGTKLAKELAKLTPNQQFLAVARAIGQIPDPTRRAAAAVAVFGRSGTMLLPLIAQMDTLRGEARKLGATMSTEQAQKAAVLHEAWVRIEGALARVSMALGAALAPALTKVANEILPMLVAVKRWIDHNQAVVVTIAKIGAVLVATGSAILAFSAAVTSTAWVIRALGMATTFVTGTFAVLRSVVVGTAAVWAVLNANMLTTSVALRAAAVASALGSTAMASARAGVLAFALAFGQVRLSALTAFSGVPALIASAWGAVVGTVTAGAALVGQALMALPGMAMAAGSVLIAGIGSAFAALPGLVIGAIGMVATAVQAIPGLVMGGFAVLRSAVAILPGLFMAAFAMLPALIGLAMSPVALLGGAIVGLGVYLYQTSDGGRHALSQLGQAFAEVKNDAVTAFGAISEALSAGDITGAVKILWSFIQLEWTRGVSWIENFMQAFAGGVAKMFLNVGFGINTAFWTAVYGIQSAIDWVVGSIVKVFSTVLGTISSKVAYLLELVGVLDEGASQGIEDLSSNLNAGVDQVRASRMAERDQKLADFKGLWDEKLQGVNSWMTEGMQGRDAEIAAKRAELDQAIADAKQARLTKGKGDEAGADTGAPVVPELDTSALSNELAQRMNTVQLKVDTLGMFNTAAIGEMGVGGTAAERGLQAQEKTARYSERIMNAVESNDLAFE
jgi:hypothetical protein